MGNRTNLAVAVLVVAALCGGLYLFFPRAKKFYPEVRSIQDMDTRVHAAAAASERFSLAMIGEVRYEDFAAPIWRIAYQPADKPKHHVFLSGSIHGNEPAGAEFLLTFANTLARQPELYPDIAFDIVPLVNPWGWAHNRRHNGDDRDLNRDFASFNAQESKLIRDYVADKSYDLMLDLHEDSSASGFYLYQLANTEMPLCRRIIEHQRATGFPIEQEAQMVFLKVHDGIIDCPYWSLQLAKGVHELSMTNYFRMTKCPRVFLFETPSRLPMKTRQAMDKEALMVLLDDLRQR